MIKVAGFVLCCVAGGLGNALFGWAMLIPLAFMALGVWMIDWPAGGRD